MCATCRISGFSLSRSSVCDCRRTLTPPSGGRPPHTHAPTDRVFHSRWHFESDFFAVSAALSKLGLGVGERHRWDIAGSLSLGQPPNNRGVAAWRIARHTTHLRRGRSRLSGLEGAYELRLGGC